MERAPLRPVPSRPPGRVDAQEAIGYVRGTLPVLDEPSAQALALVELVGRPRTEVQTEAGLSGEELAVALARGRKELRRSLYPLAGSGWCERAERMISDRIDGVLEGPGPARLDAHLNGCDRCLEHERRLAQAINALVAGFVETATEPEPEHVEAVEAVEEPQPEEEEPAPPPPPPPELRLVEAATAVPAAPTLEAGPAPPPPPQPVAQQPAAEAAAGRTASSVAWTVVLVVAVLLALAAVGIAVAVALGASI
jgi:putative zinc finger protein